MKIRILFLADTHLGFDLPFRPRVQRRRRGHDFFDNFKRAIQPALRREVDVVVHGGDLFYRSRVPDVLVDMAFAPLIEVAERGIPVYLVPGNHERSRIPLHLWSAHPNLHIFTEPKTYLEEIRGIKLTLSGFPFTREIRDKFCGLVQDTAYEKIESDIRILCMHQTVEGSRVGPSNYTFRRGKDIIQGSDIPGDFSAVLSGHIHRAQMLSSDLKARTLESPVIYPGSVERTSFAEREEEKQYVIIELVQDGMAIGSLEQVTFIALPTRPMQTIEVEVEGKGVEEVNTFLEHQLSEMDANSIVRIKPLGHMIEDVRWILSARHLRTIAPETMNISLSIPQDKGSNRRQ